MGLLTVGASELVVLFVGVETLFEGCCFAADEAEEFVLTPSADGAEQPASAKSATVKSAAAGIAIFEAMFCFFMISLKLSVRLSRAMGDE